ncbi:MAG: hypothetical protein ACYSWW_04155 [Planctomycetota bacterium]|jgi:hypothetical protein
MVAYTKRQVIDHIHLLLAIQLKKTGSLAVRCVLRDGQIELIARRWTQATDIVIIDHVMSPDTVPLRTVIHQGVDENWDALHGVHIIEPDALPQRQ